jgi:diaminopimelate epimerase
MRFTKMHGLGNDYVYVNCFEVPFPRDPAELARRMSDRHFGIGSDGLILICPSDSGADARMRMYNADGSEAEMCGNGLRCVAKYVYDHGIRRAPSLTIQTGRGNLTVDLELRDGKVARARVNMGQPILEPERIPTLLPGRPPIDVPLSVGGHQLQATAVSMGNPHCVIFVEKATDELVLGLGPKIERDRAFPARVNVEFVERVSPREVRQRTWERGSGETLACGTGASAVCVAGVLSGRTERRILNHLLGGDLELEWREDDNCVYMTGPATEVFWGEWPDEP